MLNIPPHTALLYYHAKHKFLKITKIIKIYMQKIIL